MQIFDSWRCTDKCCFITFSVFSKGTEGKYSEIIKTDPVWGEFPSADVWAFFAMAIAFLVFFCSWFSPFFTLILLFPFPQASVMILINIWYCMYAYCIEWDSNPGYSRLRTIVGYIFYWFLFTWLLFIVRWVLSCISGFHFSSYFSVYILESWLIL
jgi:hypothetical protein